MIRDLIWAVLGAVVFLLTIAAGIVVLALLGYLAP